MEQNEQSETFRPGQRHQNTVDFIMISYAVILRIDIRTQSDQFLDLFQITILGGLPNICVFGWFCCGEKPRHASRYWVFFVLFLMTSEFLQTAEFRETTSTCWANYENVTFKLANHL